MKSFESVGRWFLPEAPDTHVGGSISFSQDAGLTLTLAGSFEKGWTVLGNSYPLIHGVVSESPYGTAISLFDCFATNLRIGATSVETIRANHGYAGNAHVGSKSVTFDAAVFRFSSLRVWLRRSGLKITGRGNNTQVSWERPNPTAVQLDTGKIEIGVGLNSSGGPFSGSFQLEESPYVRVDGFKAMTSHEIDVMFAGPLTAMVTFASDNQAKLESYQLFKTDNGDDSHFDRLYSPALESKIPSSKTGSDLLFEMKDIADSFEQFMQAWFAFMRKYSAFCNIFFSYGYQTRGFVETRLLFLMLAAECFVKAETPEDSKKLEPFTLIHQTLRTSEAVTCLPYSAATLPSPLHLAWPSLFANLVDENWRLIEHVVGTTQDRFLESVFATLNYVMHRDHHAAAIEGSAMFWLHQRLAAVIKIFMLTRLQFSEDKIAEIVRRNSSMSHLRSTREPWGKAS